MMTIWVGIDGSTSSERALEWALEFASNRDESVTPVGCWTFPTVALATAAVLPPAGAMDDATRAATEKTVARVLERHPSTARIEPPHIVQGEASDVLHEQSKHGSFVVVGNRGRGGFEGLILGSVSSRLASVTECPLAIVPNTWEPGPDVRRVVVGIDTAEQSQVAAEWATNNYSDNDIELVHAWRLPPVYGIDHVSFEPVNFEEAGKRALEQLVAGLSIDDPERIHQHAAQGDARRVLLDRAADASVLILGAQRHRGIRRLILGSTAQGVLHHLVCPTVIVPTTPLESR